MFITSLLAFEHYGKRHFLKDVLNLNSRQHGSYRANVSENRGFFLLVIFSNYARIATFYKQVVSLLLSLEQYLLRKVQMSLFRSIIFFGRKCLNFYKGLSIYSKSFLHLFVLTFLCTNGPNNEAAQTKNNVNNRAFLALSLSLVTCIGMLRLALSHSFCLWRKQACSRRVNQIGS